MGPARVEDGVSDFFKFIYFFFYCWLGKRKHQDECVCENWLLILPIKRHSLTGTIEPLLGIRDAEGFVFKGQWRWCMLSQVYILTFRGVTPNFAGPGRKFGRKTWGGNWIGSRSKRRPCYFTCIFTGVLTEHACFSSNYILRQLNVQHQPLSYIFDYFEIESFVIRGV